MVRRDALLVPSIALLVCAMLCSHVSSYCPITHGSGHRFKRLYGRRSDQLPDGIESTKEGRKSGVNTKPQGLGKRLLGEICDLIEKEFPPRDAKVKQLKQFFDAEFDNLYYVHVIAMLQRCTKHKIDLSRTISLPRVVEIMHRSSQVSYAPVEIAHALYGIRYYPQQSTGMKAYLLLVVEQCIRCTDSFTGQEISNSLFGLQNFAPSPEVELLLKALSAKINQSPHHLSGQDVSNSLYGLRKMTSDNIYVKQIMVDLSVKIKSSREQGKIYLNEQGIALSLNGLQGMSSEDEETVKLVDSLLPLIKAGKEESKFSDKIVGMSLMGLKCMSADNESVRDLLRALTPKIKASNTPYTAASLSSAIYGLRRMSDQVPEVVDIVLAIIEKTRQSPDSPNSMLDGKIVSYILAGMQTMTGTTAASRALLAVVSQELAKDHSSMTDNEICRALYGLQSISAADCVEIKPVWSKISEQIRKNNRCSLELEDLVFALYSFNNQHNDIPEVIALLRALYERIAQSKMMGDKSALLSPKLLSMSMYGLRGMTSGAEETRLLLSFLQKKMSSLDPAAVGNVLYSMHKMSSEYDEVRSFLAALAPRIAECQGRLSSQELANAFYGLVGMNSDHAEVVAVVRALTPYLHEAGRRPEEPFTSQGVGNCVSGFQTMSNSDPAISAALGHLADCVEACASGMTPQDISNALFGLQGMNSDDENVRALVISLGDKMRVCQGTFSARDITYCLTGLSSMDADIHPEVADILGELNIKIAQSEVKDEAELTVIAFGKGVRLRSAKRA